LFNVSINLLVRLASVKYTVPKTMEIGDTEFSTKDISNVANEGAKLSRNLPGMIGQSNQNGEGGKY